MYLVQSWQLPELCFSWRGPLPSLSQPFFLPSSSDLFYLVGLQNTVHAPPTKLINQTSKAGCDYKTWKNHSIPRFKIWTVCQRFAYHAPPQQFGVQLRTSTIQKFCRSLKTRVSILLLLATEFFLPRFMHEYILTINLSSSLQSYVNQLISHVISSTFLTLKSITHLRNIIKFHAHTYPLQKSKKVQ